MLRRTPNALFGAIASLAAVAILAACGGGGGGGEGSGGASAAPAAAVDTPLPLTAACTDCGAVDGSTYAGAGTGVWQVSNTGSLAKDFPLVIKGLTGQLVTLVFTNETAQEVAMPSLQILSSPTTLAPTLSKSMAGGSDSADAGTAFNADVANFNRDGFARLLSTPTTAAKLSALSAPTAPAATYTMGQQRTVYLLDQSQRTVQLAGQRATSDGTAVNVWVETSELDPSRVSATLSDRVRDAFAAAGGIYDMLVKVGGPLWGPHGHTEMLAGSGQPIDIFLVNFDRNGQPYGMGGYFWGLNNFKTGALPTGLQQPIAKHVHGHRDDVPRRRPRPAPGGYRPSRTKVCTCRTSTAAASDGFRVRVRRLARGDVGD
jgi:hypothetical protein